MNQNNGLQTHKQQLIMLDRTTAPTIQTLNELPAIGYRLEYLSNGIPVYVINGGEQDVFRIDWIFDAGSIHQSKKLVAGFTNSLLDEGTKNRTSYQISNEFDFLGAYYGSGNNNFKSWFTVYGMNKYLTRLLELSEDIIKHPMFAQKELEIFRKKQINNYLEDLENLENLAHEQLHTLLYGKKHLFGQFAKKTDYEHVERNDLIDFHTNHYSSNKTTIIISGKITPDFIPKLNRYFGRHDWNNPTNTLCEVAAPNPEKKMKAHISKENAVQTAIIMGYELFNTSHPDYVKLSATNTLLGGYFGSRLMKSIREDKGYTYGIGSFYSVNPLTGFLYIQTQTANEFKELVFSEIKNQIDILKNNLVDNHELQMVKNYVAGEMQRSLDGPFAQAELIKTSLYNQVDINYHIYFWEEFKHVTTADIQQMAQKHLHFESFKIATAGK